jgi:hypothetical protein
MTEMEIEAARQIGWFYAGKQEHGIDINDALARGNREIAQMCVTNVAMIPKGTPLEDKKGLTQEHTLIISLGRPGVLIGEKGKNIDALADHMSKHFKEKVAIKISEDRLYDYLYPYIPDLDDY